MREFKYFCEKLRKREFKFDDLVCIGASSCCIISVSVGAIFFVTSMISLASCLEEKSNGNANEDKCFGVMFYFSFILLGVNLIIWCFITRCCCSCFFHGCCYKWRKYKCRKTLEALRAHEMTTELDLEKRDDVVRHLEKLVTGTWVYNDHLGNDARSLHKLNYTHIRIRYIFQIDNQASITHYFLRHLNTFPNYSLPMQLKDAPIKTKQVCKKRTYSQVSLQFRDLSRNVSRSNLGALHKNESLTDVEIHATMNSSIYRKSSTLTNNIGEYGQTSFTVDIHAPKNSISDDSETTHTVHPPDGRHGRLESELFRRLSSLAPNKRITRARSNSVVPGTEGGSVVSLFRRSSSKVRKASYAPEIGAEHVIDMGEEEGGGVLPNTSPCSPASEVVFRFSSDEEDDEDDNAASHNSAFSHNSVFQSSLNAPNLGLTNIRESDSRSSSDTFNQEANKLPDAGNAEHEPLDEIKLKECHSSNSDAKQYRRNAVNLDQLTINTGITNAGEAYLFHGTKLDNILSIIENGFILDHSKAGLYGKGIYLAESSQKADQYADQPDDRRTTFLPMFVVRTSLGRVGMYDPKTNTNLNESIKSGKMSVKSGHDSIAVEDTIVAGEKKRFREFIKQDATQCYPEFLVIYDRV